MKMILLVFIVYVALLMVEKEFSILSFIFYPIKAFLKIILSTIFKPIPFLSMLGLNGIKAIVLKLLLIIFFFPRKIILLIKAIVKITRSFCYIFFIGIKFLIKHKQFFMQGLKLCFGILLFIIKLPLIPCVIR
jgi:hypothetical protein